MPAIKSSRFLLLMALFLPLTRTTTQILPDNHAKPAGETKNFSDIRLGITDYFLMLPDEYLPELPARSRRHALTNRAEYCNGAGETTGYEVIDKSNGYLRIAFAGCGGAQKIEAAVWRTSRSKSIIGINYLNCGVERCEETIRYGFYAYSAGEWRNVTMDVFPGEDLKHLFYDKRKKQFQDRQGGTGEIWQQYFCELPRVGLSITCTVTIYREKKCHQSGCTPRGYQLRYLWNKEQGFFEIRDKQPVPPG